MGEAGLIHSSYFCSRHPTLSDEAGDSLDIEALQDSAALLPDSIITIDSTIRTDWYGAAVTGTIQDSTADLTALPMLMVENKNSRNNLSPDWGIW